MKIFILSVFLFLFVHTQAQAWIIKSDFEGGKIGEKADGLETDPKSSGATWTFGNTVYSKTDAHSGSQSAEAVLPIGSNGWKDWGMGYKFPRVSEGGELWIRVWIKFQDNFRYATEHGAKGIRLHTKAPDGSRKYIDLYPKPGHIHTENWADLKEFVRNNPDPETVRSYPGLTGWEAIELYVKASATNGTFRIWRNGKLWFEDKKTKTLINSKGYIDEFSMLTLYSSAQNSPVRQSTWIDDVFVTNERPKNIDSNGNPFIGIGDTVATTATTAPPKPPSSIQ